MEKSRPAGPRRVLYKVIGTCGLCKTRFVVDRAKGHFSGNYCADCMKKFKWGER